MLPSSIPSLAKKEEALSCPCLPASQLARPAIRPCPLTSTAVPRPKSHTASAKPARDSLVEDGGVAGVRPRRGFPLCCPALLACGNHSTLAKVSRPLHKITRLQTTSSLRVLRCGLPGFG